MCLTVFISGGLGEDHTPYTWHNGECNEENDLDPHPSKSSYKQSSIYKGQHLARIILHYTTLTFTACEA